MDSWILESQQNSTYKYERKNGGATVLENLVPVIYLFREQANCLEAWTML